MSATELPDPDAAPREWMAFAESARSDSRYRPNPFGNLYRDAFHASGYIREPAVDELSSLNERAVVPVLAIRASDWVEPIRERARRALMDRFETDPGAIVLAGPLGLALATREAGSWLAGEIRGRLETLDADGIRQCLQSRDHVFRRAVVRVAIRRAVLTSEDLRAVAEGDSDPDVRAVSAEAVLRATPAEEVYGLLQSRSAELRALAITALATSGDRGPARAALSDRAHRVRSAAQVAVRAAGESPADVYRAELSAGSFRREALAGLRETGSPDDAKLLVPFLRDPDPAIRAEAAHALRTLGGADQSVLVASLHDTSPGVVREVTKALRRSAGTVDIDLLRSLLHRGESPHVRLAGFRLLTARDARTRILTDLTLAEDDQLGERARLDLKVFVDLILPNAYLTPNADDEIARLLEPGTHGLRTAQELALRSALGLPPLPDAAPTQGPLPAAAREPLPAAAPARKRRFSFFRRSRV
ncbi:HEAT repeat domain-containing protein [Leifsonia sp. 1010]|uniref:HEAT repeat domain-containing protein n=1 Tax=Leifsonia sp. 1010 TaxID=2817769 RepID=UPI0028666AB4|nr:HEAT repeat domain-containing protein [Leifsonia sp. 1010]MDR6614000.1 HEAT repeat protein [Leifsonia sp. 1010]